ncbi:hypothetical protein RRG08_046412 [Elysia crispata]|uniref:Uncharacterized protein n=1 Tax=Elysia crispata TaxID=231223 RepID=A0AAE1AF66_9GAST|nr:hypothetical protein RRG08_046412 [Elysia crispata]
MFLCSERTQCENGWFGPDCQYQCHCVGSAPCGREDGSCSLGCHKDWFGPDCQYQRHCAGSALCGREDGSCSSGCHKDWFGPTASTCITVLGLLYVVETIVPVAQAVTRTGSARLPVPVSLCWVCSMW